MKVKLVKVKIDCSGAVLKPLDEKIVEDFPLEEEKIKEWACLLDDSTEVFVLNENSKYFNTTAENIVDGRLYDDITLVHDEYKEIISKLI